MQNSFNWLLLQESLYLKKGIWKGCMNAEIQNNHLELQVSFFTRFVDTIDSGMKSVFVCLNLDNHSESKFNVL